MAPPPLGREAFAREALALAFEPAPFEEALLEEALLVAAFLLAPLLVEALLADALLVEALFVAALFVAARFGAAALDELFLLWLLREVDLLGDLVAIPIPPSKLSPRHVYPSVYALTHLELSAQSPGTSRLSA